MTYPGDGRVFIAYDLQDAVEAQGICARLEQAGFAVWLAQRDAAASTAEQAYAMVRSAAAQCACVVLVLSGRPVNIAMLADFTQLADSAGKPIIPIRVAAQAQVPGFPALARAKAWIDASGPAAEQELARLVAELGALVPRHAPTPPQPQWSPPPPAQAMAGAPQAVPAPPVAAAQHYQPAAASPHYPAAPPAAAQAPAYGQDWNSLQVQPGETSLGSWVVALNSYGPDVTGSLTITDRRILFKPKVAGTSLVGMLLSQRKSFKDQNTVVLGRDQVVGVQVEKRMLNTWILVSTAGGPVLGFNRGLMSPDPIVAALQPR